MTQAENWKYLCLSPDVLNTQQNGFTWTRAVTKSNSVWQHFTAAWAQLRAGGRKEQDNTLHLFGCHSSQWHWEATSLSSWYLLTFPGSWTHCGKGEGSTKEGNPTSLTGRRSLRNQRRFSSSLQASRPQSLLSHLKWPLRALQFCRYWSSEKYLIILTYALSVFYIWRLINSINTKRNRESTKKQLWNSFVPLLDKLWTRSCRCDIIPGWKKMHHHHREQADFPSFWGGAAPVRSS